MGARRTKRHTREAEGPLILALDSSAFVKLFVAEDGTNEITAAARSAIGRAASRILYVEARAFLARRRKDGRLRKEDEPMARAAFLDWWRATAVVELDRELAESAGILAQRHGLRGMDAIHLASALQVSERERDLVFATWDEELRRAAVSERLRTLPA